MDIDIDITQPEEATPIELDVSTGVSYPTLDKKPQINGVILVGNKTSEELGLQPQGDYALRSELPSGGDYVGKDELAEVAFSGSYNDLSNKPTIPVIANLATKTELNTKQDKLTAGDNITIVNNVISSVGGVSDAYTKAETDNLLANKQDKGDYALKSEISGKQDIITDLVTIRNGANLGSTSLQPNDLGNATITITQDGVTKGTFTTNQSDNVSIELDAGSKNSPWVLSHLDLITTATDTSGEGLTFDISNYLPNDGLTYFVYANMRALTSNVSGAGVVAYAFSDLFSSKFKLEVTSEKNHSASQGLCTGNILIPVGAGRTVGVVTTGSTGGKINYFRLTMYHQVNLEGSI